MFVACGIWCLADVSSISPSSEQTAWVVGADCLGCGIYLALRRSRHDWVVGYF